MYCPQCGWHLTPEDSFCPGCGMSLVAGDIERQISGVSANPMTPRASVLKCGGPIHSKNQSRKFLVLLVVFILLALVLFIPHSDGSLGGKSFSETVDTEDRIIGYGRCLTPGTGFVDGDAVVATISFAEDDTKGIGFRLELTGNDIGSCSWDVSGHGIDYGTKTEHSGDRSPVFFGFYGDCTARVMYTDSSGTTVNKELGFSIDLYRSYSWKYDGGRFSFDTVIDFDETYDSSSGSSYLLPSPQIVKKQAMELPLVSKWDNVREIAVVTDTVRYIADTLGKLYTSAYGNVTHDQDYANFILAYVQICYAYASDESLYGYGEYFAFPLQTVYCGRGDCEDTSILTAAVAGAAGFRTAVFILPGHATVGIGLDDYSVPSLSEGEVLKQTVGGVTYYSGETTVDSFQQVGVIGDYIASDGSEHRYSEYLGHIVPGYGRYGAYAIDTADVVA